MADWPVLKERLADQREAPKCGHRNGAKRVCRDGQSRGRLDGQSQRMVALKAEFLPTSSSLGDIHLHADKL